MACEYRLPVVNRLTACHVSPVVVASVKKVAVRGVAAARGSAWFRARTSTAAWKPKSSVGVHVAPPSVDLKTAAPYPCASLPRRRRPRRDPRRARRSVRSPRRAPRCGRHRRSGRARSPGKKTRRPGRRRRRPRSSSERGRVGRPAGCPWVHAPVGAGHRRREGDAETDQKAASKRRFHIASSSRDRHAPRFQ